MSNPLVSVIIPTYKRPDTLDRAIKSVLAQTHKNIEVIVVDDNNPNTEGRNHTIAKMDEFADDPRVHYIKQPKNMNGSVARNTGAKASKGDFIAFLDDDDEFLPEKIESQLNRFDELPEDYAVCYNKYYSVKPGSDIRIESTETREGDCFFDALTRNLSFQAGSNMLIKRKVFESINGFDESFIRSQDKEIVVRLLEHHKIAYCPTPGLIAYIHYNHAYFNPLEVTEYYESKMKCYIEALNPTMRKKYNRIIARQRFYYALCRKEIGYAIKMIVLGELSVYDSFSVIIKGLKNKLHK